MKRPSKKTILILLVVVLLLLPFWMWLAWWLTADKKLVVAIVDKTEINRKGQEHISLTWILNHEKFTKTSAKKYDVAEDYFGFFPKENEKFRVKGLERFSDAQLDQLSEDCNIAYFADTYGVYKNEWFSGTIDGERSGILYGGMGEQDIHFLEKMKEKKKLIISEFNCIGSPTTPEIRQRFENAFALKWSGWIGRYFESLDTIINKELPRWLIANYKQQHGGTWPFKKDGIALVSDNDMVEILEQDRDLVQALPQLITSRAAQDKYDLPATMKYSFWFDIMNADTTINEIPAQFKLEVNNAGKALLAKHGLQPQFPAVIAHTGSDYRFYYFCADFCDNPVKGWTAYFKGISFFKSFFYSNDAGERGSFFWNYYRPLVTSILKDEFRRLP